jgi:hypothetical protein
MSQSGNRHYPLVQDVNRWELDASAGVYARPKYSDFARKAGRNSQLERRYGIGAFWKPFKRPVSRKAIQG